jgi:hypothetical protein
LVETVVVHGAVHVQVLPSHQGELCLWVLVWPIVRVVTTQQERGGGVQHIDVLHKIYYNISMEKRVLPICRLMYLVI